MPKNKENYVIFEKFGIKSYALKKRIPTILRGRGHL